jgi:hypothetical protein
VRHTEGNNIMGSTGTHLNRGEKMADYVLRDLDPRLTVLAHQTKRTAGGGEWQYALYAAIENGATNEVFGLVVLMHRSPSPHVWYNFHYKYVDETMGPNESDCPAKILDLLTPTDSEYANEWRSRCRANIEAKATAPRIAAGATIKFAYPLQFSDGVKTDTFTFQQRDTFQREDGARVRIPGWRRRYSWEVAA